MSFVHLHVHTEYTLSSSLLKVYDLIKKVDSFKMNAVAITDWNNLYGALHFAKAAKEKSDSRVKPIFGMELGVRVEHSGSLLRHLVLLAEDLEGFENIKRLSTLAHCEFGYEEGLLKPHVPMSELKKYSKGVIALTAGLKGILNSFLLQDQEQLALTTLEQLIDIYGVQNLFLEVQETGLSPLERCNEQLMKWSKKYSLNLLGAADVHYLTPEDAFAQEIWMMAEQKMNLDQNARSSLMTQDFCLWSSEDMKERLSHFPGAYENTQKIADRCNVELKFKDKEGKRIYHLPSFETVESRAAATPKSPEDLFAENSREGLRLRFASHLDAPKLKIYQERLEYEIETIQKMGFASYYLIVSDFIRWAKKNDIPVGPGRGSGAGSLVAFVLDITNLDPISNGLLFERFLNPERVSLPDFDVDFCQERRQEVIRYVSQRYGAERVCQIVTFAKEQSKNAIKDVGRVLGLSFTETNRLTKLIPSVQMKPLTIEESLDQVDELKQLCVSDPKIKQVMDLSRRVEGSLRQPGVHAAGVIIASRPVGELAPMSRDVNGNSITQWDMKYSEEAGLVKFDFLGLVTLDLLQLSCRLINRRSDEESKNLKYDNIPIQDPRIYKLIAKGDTLGVFQLESSGMQNLCTRIRPDCFEDIVAINALFRPGPLESGMVDDYISRKHGQKKVEVMFPEMEACLKETYGIIVYQEQVMEIARVVGGYTLGGADLLRRAMGKKNIQEMQQQRAQFVAGAEALGKPPQKAAELFDLIEKFAGYGFNKSHAAAYAVLAVQTAYLKAVYPTEFFCSILTIERDDTDKISRYIQDAKSCGMEVLAPDVNESESFFSIPAEGRIRFGLSAIKNVGEIAVAAIIEARAKGGPFQDLYDFLERVDSKRLNKRTVECLIQAGAFDTLEKGQIPRVELRARYLASVEKAMELTSRHQEKVASGQESLFGGLMSNSGANGNSSFALARQYEKVEALSEKQIFEWERALLGIYLSGSPLEKYLDKAKLLGAGEIYLLQEKAPKTVVTLAVLVSELREVRIKRGRMVGEMMGIVKLEDMTGHIELVSFPTHFKEFQNLFKSGSPLLIKAELDFEEDRPKLISGDIRIGDTLSVLDLSLIEDRWPRKIQMELHLDKIEGRLKPQNLYHDVLRIISKYPGTVPVFLKIQKTGQFLTELELGDKHFVHPTRSLVEELQGLASIPGAWRAEAIV